MKVNGKLNLIASRRLIASRKFIASQWFIASERLIAGRSLKLSGSLIDGRTAHPPKNADENVDRKLRVFNVCLKDSINIRSGFDWVVSVGAVDGLWAEAAVVIRPSMLKSR